MFHFMEHDDGDEKTSTLVSCFWCERLHAAEHPLSVCPEYAARYSTMRSLEMSGCYPLDDVVIDVETQREIDPALHHRSPRSGARHEKSSGES